MKKNLSLIMMAVSLIGCASARTTANTFRGRIIEFKSGAEGFDTRTFFYEGEKDVVAFDSQFTGELARQSIEHLRKFTSKPISWLVITHPNPDKFNGASVFKSMGARIMASNSTVQAMPEVHSYKEYFFVNIAKMFKKEDYPSLTSVDETFEGQTEIVLRGGEKIQLRELSHPGVSSTQSVAYIPSVQALIVGDLIHHRAHAWLEGGIVNGKAKPTIQKWIWALQELVTLYPAETNVFGGRGVNADLKTAASAQINYLNEARALVKSEIKAAKKMKESELKELYKKLTKKFQARFPEYDLAYMIEYSIYGLVQSEIEKK